MISAERQTCKYVISDWLATFLAFLGLNIFRYYLLDLSTIYHSLSCFIFSGKIVFEIFVIPFPSIFIYWLTGYYNLPFNKSRLQELLNTLLSALLVTVMIFLTILTNDMVLMIDKNFKIILFLYVTLFIFLYIGRLAITTKALTYTKKGYWHFNSLIVGASKTAINLAEELSRSKAGVGYNICGFVSLTGETDFLTQKDVFRFDDIDEVCKRLNITQLILAPQDYDDDVVVGLLNSLLHLGIPIKIRPDTLRYITSGIRLQDIYGEPFVTLTSPHTSEANKNIKRTIDVVASAIALIILSPVMAVIAFMVKRNSEGPAIFKQERIGFQQRPFNIYKFRTMRVDAEASGPQLSSENDSRITSIGKVLRKYRLDELPQFWNILKGDMSLVGPRPEREYYMKQILQKAPWYVLLHQIRPGLTSWGMVKYGYATDTSQMIRRARFDLVYLSNMSISVDLKIMIYTVRTIVRGEGM